MIDRHRIAPASQPLRCHPPATSLRYDPHAPRLATSLFATPSSFSATGIDLPLPLHARTRPTPRRTMPLRDSHPPVPTWGQPPPSPFDRGASPTVSLSGISGISAGGAGGTGMGSTSSFFSGLGGNFASGSGGSGNGMGTATGNGSGSGNGDGIPPGKRRRESESEEMEDDGAG